jgi:uncharacterized protein (TIGR03435 family)
MTTDRWVGKIVLGVTLLAAPIARAQGADQKALTYDVVSIKPNTSGTGGMSIRITPDGFQATNVSLHMLIANCYQMDPDRVSGLPKWGDSERFDVKAKVAESDLEALKKIVPKDRGKLLESIMTDRFKVVTYRETRELPVYDMTVAKSGLKMTEAKPGDTYPNGMKSPDGVGRGGMMRAGRGTMTAQGVPMKNLVSFLGANVQRPVIDKTGLTGVYDMELKWTPEDAPAGGTDETGPSIFTALQEQLGLRLDASKGMVETLIVDHAEKPSED